MSRGERAEEEHERRIQVDPDSTSPSTGTSWHPTRFVEMVLVKILSKMWSWRIHDLSSGPNVQDAPESVGWAALNNMGGRGGSDRGSRCDSHNPRGVEHGMHIKWRRWLGMNCGGVEDPVYYQGIHKLRLLPLPPGTRTGVSGNQSSP